MSVRVGVLILCVRSVIYGVVPCGFVPECDVCCGFVVVVVLYVLGNALEAFSPMPGIFWWQCCWVDPHGDEAVGQALLIVVDK